tara:strand:+ start:6389 stop:6634 length:246 start_codon:yes stop_codon:yes gene_type:complete
MSVGWLFKTPGDDATESTLRALHTQNKLDEYYYRGFSWLRTVIAVTIAVLLTSYIEVRMDYSVWDNFVIWWKDKIAGWVGL